MGQYKKVSQHYRFHCIVCILYLCVASLAALVTFLISHDSKSLVIMGIDIFICRVEGI